MQFLENPPEEPLKEPFKEPRKEPFKEPFKEPPRVSPQKWAEYATIEGLIEGHPRGNFSNYCNFCLCEETVPQAICLESEAINKGGGEWLS